MCNSHILINMECMRNRNDEFNNYLHKNITSCRRFRVDMVLGFRNHMGLRFRIHIGDTGTILPDQMVVQIIQLSFKQS